MLHRRKSPTPEQRISSAINFAQCPAKTYQRNDGTTVPGRNVLEHCHIVGAVAQRLIEFFPDALQSTLFPPGTPLVAACHDIGKVSPSFVEKLRRACNSGTEHIPSQPISPELEKQWGGHAGVSQVAAQALAAPDWVPEILGQHHGFSPTYQLAGKQADAEIFGGSAWQAQRSALVQALQQRLGMDWPRIANPVQARLLAGLTSVADWIGSGKHFEDPACDWQPLIDLALQEAGWIQPSYRSGLTFSEVFGLEPRPAQNQLIEAANAPGVYVLEAPMGLGKTEAALYVAYRMVSGGHASGIYFALPTQLTSNKIYERFNAFLSQILSPDCPHRQALLLHGKAWLQRTEMGEEGRPGGAWFHQAKRGLLAPFAVGTIDQALMAAMNVKHGFVRAFGLAGKVVILDEVHTYDAYTGTLLDALVTMLRGLHCTVIILSATLHHERRGQLLQAPLHSKSYPLITALRDALQSQHVQEYPVAPPPSTKVQVRLLQDDALALQEALDRAAQNQQVLWIENTVDAAQQRFLDLASRAAELGVECGLLHSRFTAADRQHIEDHWVGLFGKSGWTQRAKQGRILIGTQVLEQSLDIDADFLVTSFAPTDMLLQRFGRLWRHQHTPRTTSAICEAWLLAPDLDQAIKQPLKAFGSSAYVYAPYVLCRSLEAWQMREQVILPDDIRGLIDDTYSTRTEQGDMARWFHDLEYGTSSAPGRPGRKGRQALQQLARIGLARDGKTLSDVDAPTRYSDSETREVLLLRHLHYDSATHTTRLALLDGSTITLPTQRHLLDKQAWKNIAAQLMQQQVPVRAADAPLPPPRSELQKLGFGHCFYLGSSNWEEDVSSLHVCLVDETGQLRGLNGAPVHDRYRLEYRTDLGYHRLNKNS